MINDNPGFTTTELDALLFSVRINLLRAIILTFGIGFLAFALAGRLRMMASNGGHFFEGIGLVIAIVGFFAYGFAMEEIIDFSNLEISDSFLVLISALLYVW